MPMEPVSMAASSVRMSPNMFSAYRQERGGVEGEGWSRGAEEGR